LQNELKLIFQTSHNQTHHKASKASALIDILKIFLELLEGSTSVNQLFANATRNKKSSIS